MKQENVQNQTILTSFSDILGPPQINSEMPKIFSLILEMQLFPLAGLPCVVGLHWCLPSLFIFRWSKGHLVLNFD